VEIDAGKPVIKGKFVQGPRSDPFVYLAWGDWEGAAWTQVGRAKIPLGAIPPGLLERALREGSPLCARIRMVDGRGRPALATLKPGQVEWLG
jgi:hypothetical protein